MSLSYDLLIECVEIQIQTSGEYQRAEKDIAAQESMSEWAYWLLMLSTVSILITGGMGVFIWQTLIATRDMATDQRLIGGHPK